MFTEHKSAVDIRASRDPLFETVRSPRYRLLCVAAIGMLKTLKRTAFRP
jgi:hypothetical protein